MTHRTLAFAALALLGLTPPAGAVVRGTVDRNPDGLRASVVRVESSGGELCSGVMIRPDVVLTAAHCVLDRASYRVVGVDRRFRQRSVRAVAAAMHPDFVPGTTPRTQPGIDLALLKLEAPLGPDFVPLDPRQAGGVARGEPVDIAGFGVGVDGRAATARTLRRARLVSLGSLQVANRVLVVADAGGQALNAGAGACRGDSGGPILRGGPGGYQLLGIVSWSSGAFNNRSNTACGGFTAVTPVAEHAGWIVGRTGDLDRLTQGLPLSAPRVRGNQTDWVARSR